MQQLRCCANDITGDDIGYLYLFYGHQCALFFRSVFARSKFTFVDISYLRQMQCMNCEHTWLKQRKLFWSFYNENLAVLGHNLERVTGLLELGRTVNRMKKVKNLGSRTLLASTVLHWCCRNKLWLYFKSAIDAYIETEITPIPIHPWRFHY